jgi:hypothetical protein
MAEVITYPLAIPAGDTRLVGTLMNVPQNEGPGLNLTRNFLVSDVANLAVNNYLESTTNITNAQWLALGGTSVVLVPNPGANKYIKLLEASIFFDFNAAASFAFTNLEIAPAGGNSQAVLTAAVASPVTGDQVWTLATTNSLINSAALVFRNLTATNPTGAGTVQVKVRYQVLNTSAF